MLRESAFPASFEKSHLKEKGQSLLEMAFAMIVLLILLAGVVDLGRLLFTYIALRDAAEEGAVFASFCPPLGDGNAKVEAHIRASSQFPVDLSSPDVQIGSSWAPGSTGTVITIIVTHTKFEFLMPFIGPILGTNEIQVRAQAQTYALQFECPPD